MLPGLANGGGLRCAYFHAPAQPLVLAPCYFHRVGSHHAEENPGHFSVLVADFNLAQAIMVLVIAIAALQICRAGLVQLSPLLVFFFAQLRVGCAPAFRLEACADALIRTVRAVVVCGIYPVCCQFLQLPKMLAVECNAFFQPYALVESFEAAGFSDDVLVLAPFAFAMRDATEQLHRPVRIDVLQQLSVAAALISFEEL